MTCAYLLASSLRTSERLLKPDMAGDGQKWLRRQHERRLNGTQHDLDDCDSNPIRLWQEEGDGGTKRTRTGDGESLISTGYLLCSTGRLVLPSGPKPQIADWVGVGPESANAALSRRERSQSGRGQCGLSQYLYFNWAQKLNGTSVRTSGCA